MMHIKMISFQNERTPCAASSRQIVAEIRPEMPGIRRGVVRGELKNEVET